MNELLSFLLAVSVFAWGYVRGKNDGILTEWTRLHDRQLRQAHAQRQRDGRTRDFKRAAKAAKNGGAK